MRILDVEQGSEEWFEAKAGVVSASRMRKIMGKPNNSGYKEMLYKIATERVRGKYSHDGYSNYAMRRGTDLEMDARESYDRRTGFFSDEPVRQVGFILGDDERIGCSPDGLRADRGLEIKCPLPHTHGRYVDQGRLPSEYVCQVQFSMFVTGLSRWDFFSYCPGLKPLLVEVKPDKGMFRTFKDALNNFFAAVEKIEQKVRP